MKFATFVILALIVLIGIALWFEYHNQFVLIGP